MSITDGLITLTEFQSFTTYHTTGPDQVAQAEQSIEAASRAVERYCGRQFHPDTVSSARVFDPADAHRVHVDDLRSVTSLKTDDDQDGVYERTWTTAQYQLLPAGGRTITLGPVPYTEIATVAGNWFLMNRWRSGLIEVTALWGWAAAPTPVKRATALMALDFLKGPETTFGAAPVGDFVTRIRIHPHVVQLLAPYVRAEITVGIA